MCLGNKIKQLLNKCLGNSNSTCIQNIPKFEESEERRYSIIFSGLVQGVGFRYETWCIAQKLGVVGFAENLPNGDVRVEAQGQKDKLLYLVNYMKNIPRIHVEKIEINEVELKDEKEFMAIY